MAAPLLQVRSLSKSYCKNHVRAVTFAASDFWSELRGRSPCADLRADEFWAVRNVSFSMQAGEALGVLGRNGAGKSTLINLVAGLLRPTSGEVTLSTDRVALLDHEGCLDGAETGRENIAIQLIQHGCSPGQLPGEIEAALEFAEIEEFADAPVGMYSLGMRQRLGFSIWTRLRPDLLIVDEALSGGDIHFRNKFLRFIREFIDGGGSILFCSHDPCLLMTFCRRSLLLERGRLIYDGDTAQALESYFERTGVTNPEGPPAAPTVASQSGLDQELRLVSFCISAPDSQAITPGGPVLIEMSMESKLPPCTVLWGLEIGSRQVFPLTTFGVRTHLEPGLNRFRCSVDHLPLPPGQYFISTSVNEMATGATLRSVGYHQDAGIRFQVEDRHEDSRDGFQSVLFRWRRPLVHVDGRFEREGGGD